MRLYKFARTTKGLSATIGDEPLPIVEMFLSAQGGIAWGESSVRAQNLAYSLLKHAKGDIAAQALYSYFVGDVLAHLTIDCWSITAKQIDEYADYRSALGEATQKSPTPITNGLRDRTVPTVIKAACPQFLLDVNKYLRF